MYIRYWASFYIDIETNLIEFPLRIRQLTMELIFRKIKSRSINREASERKRPLYLPKLISNFPEPPFRWKSVATSAPVLLYFLRFYSLFIKKQPSPLFVPLFVLSPFQCVLCFQFRVSKYIHSMIMRCINLKLVSHFRFNFWHPILKFRTVCARAKCMAFPCFTYSIKKSSLRANLSTLNWVTSYWICYESTQWNGVFPKHHII